MDELIELEKRIKHKNSSNKRQNAQDPGKDGSVSYIDCSILALSGILQEYEKHNPDYTIG